MGERGKEQETEEQSVSLLAHQCVYLNRITRAGGSRLGEMEVVLNTLALKGDVAKQQSC
jgi:hypothetical protein